VNDSCFIKAIQFGYFFSCLFSEVKVRTQVIKKAEGRLFSLWKVEGILLLRQDISENPHGVDESLLSIDVVFSVLLMLLQRCVIRVERQLIFASVKHFYA